jgi:hypothetical protein
MKSLSAIEKYHKPFRAGDRIFQNEGVLFSVSKGRSFYHMSTSGGFLFSFL